MDIVAQNVLEEDHTTTINIYKLNYEALIFTLVFFFVIVVMIFYLWKGKRIKTMKPPVPVIYYLAKTAYKKEHEELCMALIQKEEYDLNYTNSDLQLSTFLCACLSGNADLVSFMIKKGANVHTVSSYGDSGLYLAVYGLSSKTSDFKILDILLSAGCDINCQNDNGFTVLHLAGSKGNFSLVNYLLEKGADPTIASTDSVLPYDMAVIEGHEEIAQYLKNKRCIQ
ncbi:ANK_REP_REGION domain-containing protein [Caerostris extrusa]|uniref:Alpha-latrotoxin n=1 Tax=Caerostris extrusa TaxID=172846 RepID=A0AAV4TZN2_CAEEX|nr:ANK_REP_REGION domain-containing protein [Caerostris extrusa]